MYAVVHVHSVLCISRVSPTEIQGTSYNVKGLTEGREYEFRVATVNDDGPGPYAELSDAIKAAPPTSKLIFEQRMFQHIHDLIE